MYRSHSVHGARQSTLRQRSHPLPLALNGILTPDEFAEQTQYGLLRSMFETEQETPIKPISETELFHPFFKN